MKCPYCGAEVAPDIQVCPVCQQQLSTKTSSSSLECEEVPMMGMGDAMARGFLKYAVFRGRARRSEYWFFFLFCGILAFILSLAMVVFLQINISGGRFVDVVNTVNKGDKAMLTYLVVMAIFLLLLVVPSIALTVRRLHDTGRSGWWALLAPISPLNIILIVFLFLDSEQGRNKYGNSNKYVIKE